MPSHIKKYPTFTTNTVPVPKQAPTATKAIPKMATPDTSVPVPRITGAVNNPVKPQMPKMSTGSNMPKPGSINQNQSRAVPTFITSANIKSGNGVTPNFIVPNSAAGTTTTSNPAIGNNGADYWNKNFGGRDKYAADQNKRYTDAIARNDTQLIGNLIADSQRVGYQLNAPMPKREDTTPTTPVTDPIADSVGGFTAPTPTESVPIYTPSLPVRDTETIRKYVDGQYGRQLSDLRLYADQQIRGGETTANQQLQALQTGFDRQRQTLGEDRAVQDVQAARNLSPFSGRSDYALGMMAQERGRTDREMQQDFASRQASIGQDLANLRSTIEEKYAALQNAAPTEKEALFQQILNDERQYDLAVNGQQIEGLMANSQLNNTAFNQALQTYGANRQAFENDRAFDYSKYQDQVNWTGQLSNGQKTAQQQQQEWENRFNYGQAIGQFSNGQQTLDNQRFQYTQGRDKIADQQWQAEFDRIKEQDGIQNAIAWANQNLNERQESRIAANQFSSLSGSGNYKPSTASTIQDINLPRTAASMETYIINNLPGGKNVFGPPSPNQSTLIESMILDNPNLSEADIIKLYKRFGISLPE